MKKKIIIEEVISQEFEIDLDEEKKELEQVREKYLAGDFVLDSASLTEVNYAIIEDGKSSSNWIDLHV